jgi:type II secretory pathway component PulF
MADHALCVHTHFGLLPRNITLSSTQFDPMGEMLQGLNEKLTAACYAPNSELRNFERMSYDIGGALARWLEENTPETGSRIVAADRAYAHKKGHYYFSRLTLSLPLFGEVIKQAFIVMFCSTMSTLVTAGVSVLDVFDILSGMSDNDVIKSAIVRTRESVVGGLNISTSMASVGFFPNMVIKMMQVGEESGSLARVLERTSAHYERKVDSTITMMTAMLEPIMIVSVGAIVLCVVLALYLPIFTMSDVK